MLATLFVATLALGVTVALAAEIGGSPSSPATPRVAFATGQFEIANSSADQAIVSADHVALGSSSSGQVTITNSGDMAGTISLAKSDVVDQPGPAGGALSDIADVTVTDVTAAQAPTTVYTGRLVAMPDIALGAFAPSEARTYDFTVSLPEAGAGSGDINAYQSASLRFGYVWTGTAPDEPPPPAQETPGDSAAVPGQTTTDSASTPDGSRDSTDAPPNASGSDTPAPQAPAIAGAPGGAAGAPDRAARGDGTTRAERRDGGRERRPRGSATPDRATSAAKHQQKRSGLAKLFHALKRVASAAAEKGSFPGLLLLLLAAFFFLQGWLDRRDPKLALAPVDAEPTRTFG